MEENIFNNVQLSDRDAKINCKSFFRQSWTFLNGNFQTMTCTMLKPLESINWQKEDHKISVCGDHNVVKPAKLLNLLVNKAADEFCTWKKYGKEKGQTLKEVTVCCKNMLL